MFTRYPWWGGGNRGPCDFSVSPSPIGLDFGVWDFRLWLHIFFLVKYLMSEAKKEFAFWQEKFQK